MNISEMTNEYGLTDGQYQGLVESAKKLCELHGVDEISLEKHDNNIYIFAVHREEIANFEDEEDE